MQTNKRGEYTTVNKKLRAAGFDPKNMTMQDWQKFAAMDGNAGHNGNGNGHVDIEPDKTQTAQQFSYDQIDEMIAADKKRASLKDGEPAKAIDPSKIPYADFSTEEEKEQQKKQQTDEEYRQQKTDQERAEEEFKKKWGNLDGSDLLFGYELLMMKAIPMLCKRFHKKAPPPENIVLSESAKILMKPGADMLMRKILMMLKSPEYMLYGGIAAHITVIMLQAEDLPIEDEDIPFTETETVNE